MKRLVAIIAMILYAAFSIGLEIDHHFCYDREWVSIFGDPEECEKNSERSACEESALKLSDEHRNSTNLLKKVKPAATIRTPNHTLASFLSGVDTARQKLHFNNNILEGKNPIYLTNCIFII